MKQTLLEFGLKKKKTRILGDTKTESRWHSVFLLLTKFTHYNLIKHA